MTTIYLRFADRAAALSALGSVLGYASTAEEAGGKQMLPSGHLDGVRYDLCFLSDQGVTAGGGDDLVNVLWWGEASGAPDFGASVVVPQTPSCGFAA